MRLTPEKFKLDTHDYQEMQRHSNMIDKELDVRVEEIEKSIISKAKEAFPEANYQSWGPLTCHGAQTWIGLNHEQLQTPYNEFYRLCKRLSPKAQEHWVDLGASYGRLGIVLHAFESSVCFTGFEYIDERVVEGNRIFKKYGLINAQLITQDLTAFDFELPEADVYFLYDFSTPTQIHDVLDKLGDLSLKKKFRVVARGRGCRSVVDHKHPWLDQIFSSDDGEHYAIYQS